MSIEAFTKLIPEYEGYPDEAIIRIECSVRELRGLGNSKPIAWMNPNAPEGVFARHEEGARNFGCTVPLYAAPTTKPERVSVPISDLKEAMIWLDGALKCKSFVWDHDQHEFARSVCDRVFALLAAAQPEQVSVPVSDERKLWLWKNFVDGRPEYWAFDNPYPIHLHSDDPQTLGEPCGYAIFKESRTGRTDVSEAEVLSRIKKAAAQEGK